MLILVITLALAAMPSLAWLVVLLILLGEITSGRSDSSRTTRPMEIEWAFLLFSIFTARTFLEGIDLLNFLPTAILLATIGLALSHAIVHKYNLFHLTVLYRVHRDHHNPETDPEAALRREGLPRYVKGKLLVYLKGKWTALDFLLVAFLAISGPLAVATALLALVMVEVIGFHQHTPNDIPIDSHNRFTNYISGDSGLHAAHHGRTTDTHSPTPWEYGALTGLLAALTWAAICLFLRILLLLPWPKANVPGAYLFGFRQNVGNYIGANGRSVGNLLLRIPSVFEKPSLLPQYLKAMTRKEKITGFKLVTPTQTSIEALSLSHGVCRNRNIYLTEFSDSPAPPSKAPIVVYGGTVIEGHHRYMAGVRTGIVEILPEENSG